MSSLHQASALMYLTGRAASAALAYVKKPRRQPYVTYVAYFLMCPALSGTRANSP